MTAVTGEDGQKSRIAFGDPDRKGVTDNGDDQPGDPEPEP